MRGLGIATKAGGNLSKQIRIIRGVHRGAESLLGQDGRCLIGSDPSCSVVLYDSGVAARHCVIAADAYGITCRALDAAIVVDGRTVPSGEAVSLTDFQILQCGSAALAIGPVESEWPQMEAVAIARRVSAVEAVRSLKRLNPYALFATMLAGLTCVLGLAYAALSSGDVELTPARVTAARQWLQGIAPAGSELQIGVENSRGQGLLLSGYVPLDKQVAFLTDAARNSSFKPRVDVYSTDQMVASLSRLTQLAAIPCTPAYRSGGQMVCTNEVANEELATRLRMIARDVPGLTALDLQVAPRPVPVAAPPVVEVLPARITQKFAVVMSRRGRYLLGRYGKKYTEGQQFDGFVIQKIGLDQVVFERDGRQYEFYVAALNGTGSP